MVWVAIAVLTLIVLAAGCVQSGEKAATETSTGTQIEIPIGVLVDLSGPLTTYGRTLKLQLQLLQKI